MQDDEHADALVSNVYRWLSSPKSSKLYDPLLHRLVHKLMKKNFISLLRKLKTLGCKVIYGSFHKLFVYTDRQTLAEAQSHISFVTENIAREDLFAFLKLQPVEFWRILLFKDAFNYAGVNETSPSEVISRLDIVQHLPQATRR